MRAAYIDDNPQIINGVYSTATQEKLAQMFDFYDGVYTSETFTQLKDVDCLFSTWGMPSLTEEQIREHLPNLKVLFYGAGSVQRFARPFLNCGVKVISAWMANSVPVIEYTVAQIILANTGFYQANRRAVDPDGREDARLYGLTFPGNYDTAVGLIGLGAIGSGVAEMLKAYKLNVYAYDPFASKEKCDALGVTSVSLEELFSTCQTISNHTANLPETVGMLNGKYFSLMKDNATFINTGRGAQVVEADLIAALREKPDRTAVLDVTLPEPPESDSPFYSMPNVYLTPHIAGSKGNECMRMGQYMMEEAERYIAGEDLKYSVTFKMLETMA